MNSRTLLAVVWATCLLLAACGSSGSGGPTSPAKTAPVAATGRANAPSPAAATKGGATCPTLAQANAALGVSFSGSTRTAGPGGSIVCEYTGGPGGANAGVTIFAHETAEVFNGQVANAGRAPGMEKVSGVGDGAFAQSTSGHSVVNAWSNGSRTVVAAQGPVPVAQTEALARVALSDN